MECFLRAVPQAGTDSVSFKSHVSLQGRRHHLHSDKRRNRLRVSDAPPVREAAGAAGGQAGAHSPETPLPRVQGHWAPPRGWGPRPQEASPRDVLVMETSETTQTPFL